MAPQSRHPAQIPSPAISARRPPSTAAVRKTSAVSRPGVIVRIAAASVKASRAAVAVMVGRRGRRRKGDVDVGKVHNKCNAATRHLAPTPDGRRARKVRMRKPPVPRAAHLYLSPMEAPRAIPPRMREAAPARRRTARMPIVAARAATIGGPRKPRHRPRLQQRTGPGQIQLVGVGGRGASNLDAPEGIGREPKGGRR